MMSDPPTAPMKIFVAEEGREPDLSNPDDVRAITFLQLGFMIGVFSYLEYTARLPEPAPGSDPKFFYFDLAKLIFKQHVHKEFDINNEQDLYIASYIHIGLEHARRCSLREGGF